jgi:IclR family acetate operon transcriptional repressor
VSNQYVINSAYRTLQVLLAFAAPPHRFSLAEIITSMDGEKGQLYRSLKTLEEAGFVRVGSDGRFALTPVVNLLSSAFAGTRQASLMDVAGPYLDRLAQESDESVNLFVLASDRAVCVDGRESRQQVRLATPLGVSVPLHAGAVPKAMLAYLPGATWERVLGQLESLPRYTDATVLQPARLRSELESIRGRGYSVSDEDYDASARGVGAPVFDASAQVVGGISVGGPSFRVGDETLERFGALITRVARAMSKQLGYPG